ncbi:unnamed protein product [Parnassius apollo]|uniref:(apollo) hypothetical protein n=1 Tax=Parnassius apollo TaxID=110799 RepID=A0A8S3W3J4_PARAO|nr:unnamed protein product [Parnassius apollo]
MKSTRSEHMLSLLLRPLDKMNTASDPAAKSYEQLDFSEHNVDNRAVIPQSPLPQEAENIHQDMAEVCEDVFGPPHIPPYVTSDKTGLKSLRAVEKFRDIKSIPLKPADSEEPLAIEVPSSFENSPEIGFGDLPLVSAPNVSTPVPSPLNSHADCCDCFSSICEHWTQSPSATNTSSAPYNSSDDERSASTKKRVKKRVRRTSEWSDVKRKCLNNIGKKYVTKKGKIVDDKILDVPCKCRYQCFKKIFMTKDTIVFRSFGV